MILHRLVTAAEESGLLEKYGGVIIAVSSCVEYDQLELHLKTSPSGELIMQVVAFGVRIMHAFTGLRQPVVDLAKNMDIPLQEGTLPYDEPGHELRAQIFEIEPNTYTAGLVLPSELTIGDLVTMLRENADTLLAMRRRGNAANN